METEDARTRHGLPKIWIKLAHAYTADTRLSSSPLRALLESLVTRLLLHVLNDDMRLRTCSASRAPPIDQPYLVVHTHSLWYTPTLCGTRPLSVVHAHSLWYTPTLCGTHPLSCVVLCMLRIQYLTVTEIRRVILFYFVCLFVCVATR